MTLKECFHIGSLTEISAILYVYVLTYLNIKSMYNA